MDRNSPKSAGKVPGLYDAFVAVKHLIADKKIRRKFLLFSKLWGSGHPLKAGKNSKSIRIIPRCVNSRL